MFKKSNKQNQEQEEVPQLDPIAQNNFKTVRARIVLNEGSKLPGYAHLDGDSLPMDGGMDLIAKSITYNVKNDYYVCETGLNIESPQGTMLLITPRSSNRKTDFYIPNSPCIIDYGYAGDVSVCFKNRTSMKTILFQRMMTKFFELAGTSLEKSVKDKILAKYNPNNLSDEEITEIAMSLIPFKPGDKIAQCFINPYPFVEWEVVNSIPDLRGGGFGSTGN